MVAGPLATPERLSFELASCRVKDVALRRYRDTDRAGCLAVMRTNVPRYFLQREVNGFGEWLANRTSPYFVVERDGDRIVGCGGYRIDQASGVAHLVWGMIASDIHRRGLGSLLFAKRLDEIRGQSGVHEVWVDTSQHSQGFFERLGFVVQSKSANGHGDGIDSVRMRLALRSP